MRVRRTALDEVEEKTVADTKQGGPASIEHELGVPRERLAGTIDELLYRASPKTIVKREIASIRGYFVDAQGNPRTDNILKVVGGVAVFIAFVVVIRKVTG